MWEHSLLLFTADNGGVGSFGNNFPLRGHKHDPWEGGTRAVAFLAGGVLPGGLRGSRSSALVHISDWVPPTGIRTAVVRTCSRFTGVALPVLSGQYPTFCSLAGAPAADDANMSGSVHPIDGVDVWPLLVGANTTQPRSITVITEVSAIEVVGESEGHAAELWKLVTLAGQSNFYDKSGAQLNGSGPCLAGRQPDPPQPGRTDPIVNGPAAHEHQACPVCNETRPCLFELVADPSERTNRATDAGVSDRIARLADAIADANTNAYVSGTLDAQVLARDYEPVDPHEWKGFTGPCFRRRKR
eukprot:4584405-Prymnesium_polylepis.1